MKIEKKENLGEKIINDWFPGINIKSQNSFPGFSHTLLKARRKAKEHFFKKYHNVECMSINGIFRKGFAYGRQWQAHLTEWEAKEAERNKQMAQPEKLDFSKIKKEADKKEEFLWRLQNFSEALKKLQLHIEYDILRKF